MITTEAELHIANRAYLFAQPLRSYRISWKWKSNGQTFGATTLWLSPGDKDAALKDFTAKNPAAISVRVVEEVV